MASSRKKGPTATTRNGVQARLTADGQRRYRARVFVDGHQCTGKWLGSHAEAARERDQFRSKGKRRKTVAVRWTLGDGMTAVIRDMQESGMRPASIKDRQTRFAIVSRFIDAGVQLTDIEPETIEQFVQARLREPHSLDPSRTVQVATVLGDVRALNTVFTLAIFRGAIDANPIKRVRLPRPKRGRDIAWFAPAEMAEVLRRIREWPKTHRLTPERDAAIVEFIALTGLRLAEATALRWEDVSAEQGLIRVSHDSGKRGFRVAKIGPDITTVLGVLEEHRKSDRVIPITYQGLITLLRRWATRLDEPRLRCHALRHTYGTALAAAGVSAHALTRAMGHATLQTSMIYVHQAGAVEHHVSYRGSTSAASDPTESSDSSGEPEDGAPADE